MLFRPSPPHLNQRHIRVLKLGTIYSCNSRGCTVRGVKVWVPLFPMQVQSFYGVQTLMTYNFADTGGSRTYSSSFYSPNIPLKWFWRRGIKSTLKVCQTILKSNNLLHKEWLVQTGVATTVSVRTHQCAPIMYWERALFLNMIAKRTTSGACCAEYALRP